MAIIESDSALVRTPIQLSGRQLLYADTLRITIEMFDLVTTRLQHDLTQVQLQNHVAVGIPALADAWLAIHYSHRLINVLRKFPGIKHRRQISSFQKLEFFAPFVKALNNSMHQLERHVDIIERDRLSIYGVLTWLDLRADGSRPTAFAFVPGASRGPDLSKFPHTCRQPALRLPIDHVTLYAAGISVCLTELREAVTAVTVDVESAMNEAYAQQYGEKWAYSASHIVVSVMEVQNPQPESDQCSNQR